MRNSSSVNYSIDEYGRPRCLTCGWMYDFDDLNDIKEHKKKCRKYQKMVKALKYRPAHYEEREQIKKEARRVLSRSTDLLELIDAQMRLMQTYFDRSLLRFAGTHDFRLHPCFEEYIARYPRDLIQDEELVDYLDKTYGRADNTLDLAELVYQGEA